MPHLALTAAPCRVKPRPALAGRTPPRL